MIYKYIHVCIHTHICQNNSRNYQFVFIRFYGWAVKVLSPHFEGFSSSTSHALGFCHISIEKSPRQMKEIYGFPT